MLGVLGAEGQSTNNRYAQIEVTVSKGFINFWSNFSMIEMETQEPEYNNEEFSMPDQVKSPEWRSLKFKKVDAYQVFYWSINLRITTQWYAQIS